MAGPSQLRGLIFKRNGGLSLSIISLAHIFTQKILCAENEAVDNGLIQPLFKMKRKVRALKFRDG